MTLPKNSSGQSLVEIIIALTIGGLLIGAASAVIAVMLKSDSALRLRQTGVALNRSLMEEAHSFADGNWNEIYALTKGSSVSYYFLPSSTAFKVVGGKEGLIENDIRTGLVGYWGIDEAAGPAVYDHTRFGNNGVIFGSPSRSSAGACRVSGCLDLNGTDSYVDLGDTIDLGPGADLTIAFWFKTAAASGPNKPIISKLQLDSGPDTGYGIDFSPSGGWISGQLASANIYKTVLSANAPVNDGKWRHIAFAVDRDSALGLRLFIDGAEPVYGQKDDPTPLSTADLSHSYPLRIGRDSDHPAGGFLAASVDDIRVYSRALSADEVWDIYNSAIFSRSFYIENVERNAGAIVSSGGVNDPSTQKITAVTEWQAAASTSTITLSDFVVRWRNEIFNQTDWSGQTGAAGPIIEPTGSFASSSGVSTSTGGIRLFGYDP